MSVLAAKDDYTNLCEGVRKITGIDLLQYKRGQMERRIRTFAQKQGITDLNEYLKVLQRDKAVLDHQQHRRSRELLGQRREREHAHRRQRPEFLVD